MPARKKKRRRTQEERSAETRTLLLDTTLSCLHELGYAKTTSQIVADRAGLSRGAQLHHFGGKAQLVSAAMEHLFDRMDERFRIDVAELPRDGEFVGRAIAVVWEIMAGPVGYAYIELVCASRTDPELRDELRSSVARMDERLDATFRELFDDAAGIPAKVIWTALFSLMEGLAFERIVKPDDENIDLVVEAVKRLAPLAFTPR